MLLCVEGKRGGGEEGQRQPEEGEGVGGEGLGGGRGQDLEYLLRQTEVRAARLTRQTGPNLAPRRPCLV